MLIYFLVQRELEEKKTAKIFINSILDKNQEKKKVQKIKNK